MSLLRLDEVTRSVQLPDDETLEILKGVTLDVEVGDHVSIVGRSGSGKSTLLNLLGLLDAPTSGSIWFDDRLTSTLSGNARDRARGADIGFIFQQFNLLGGRTALENVMTPLLFASGGSSGVDASSRPKCSRKSVSVVALARCPRNSPVGSSSGWRSRER